MKRTISLKLLILTIFLISPLRIFAEDATPSATIESHTPTPQVTITEENFNQMISRKQATAIANTGENTHTNGMITTGSATAEAKLETIANTSISGKNNCVFFLNIFEKRNKDVDLSDLSPDKCNPLDKQIQSPDTISTNSAQISNTINLVANTGYNSASGEASLIATGPANSKASISNIVNTNIIGTNTFHGVINIFSPMHGNIVLPDTELFTNVPIERSKNVSVRYQSNTANIKNSIVAEATTGRNTGNEIQTGSETTTIRIVDIANTNILGSGFVIMQINDLQNLSQQAAHFPPDATQSTELLNIVDIKNDISLSSNTGANNAESFVRTGDASATVFIANILNTNIVGDNWFHLIVNMFDTFSGDVLFTKTQHLNRPIQQDSIKETVSVTRYPEPEITIKYERYTQKELIGEHPIETASHNIPTIQEPLKVQTINSSSVIQKSSISQHQTTEKALSFFLIIPFILAILRELFLY